MVIGHLTHLWKTFGGAGRDHCSGPDIKFEFLGEEGIDTTNPINQGTKFMHLSF
jgi:hypothetical protein